MSTFFSTFFKKNCLYYFFIFLLQKIQKFPDSAQSRQILWVVKPKKIRRPPKSERAPNKILGGETDHLASLF